MKNILLLVLFSCVYLPVFACCISDSRLLSQRILEKNAGNIIWAKALHDSNGGENSDFYTKMQVIQVFFGKVDSSVITLNSGSKNSSVGGTFIKKGSEWLIFNGAGSYFYGGNICDPFFCSATSDRGKTAINMLSTFSDYIQYEKTGAIAINYGDGKPAVIGNFVNGKMDGEWKQYGFQGYLNNDTRIFINHYTMGELDGEQQSFYNATHLKAVNYYKNGKLQGKAIGYHENGKIASVHYYENGDLIGESQSFADNGNITLRINYENGKMTKLAAYFPNITGQIKQTQSIIYQDTTEVIFTEEYTEQGFLKKQIASESRYNRKGQHLGGYYEGKYVTYHLNSLQIQEIGIRHLGKNIGIWTKYDINGVKIDEKDWGKYK